MPHDTIEFMAGQDDAVGNASPSSNPLRAQRIQRIQVGVFGLAVMVLLVGLANIVIRNANENEARVVPEAAPTVEVPKIVVPTVSDPLADAGVVPDIRATPGTNGAPAAENPDGPDLDAP